LDGERLAEDGGQAGKWVWAFDCVAGLFAERIKRLLADYFLQFVAVGEAGEGQYRKRRFGSLKGLIEPRQARSPQRPGNRPENRLDFHVH